MSSVPDATQVLCRQCNAPLPIEQGTQFVTCKFCGTTNFINKGRAVFHYAVRTTVRENDALAALGRWMAGNKTVKDLDKKAQIERPEDAAFTSATVTPGDARKLLEFIVLVIEARRKDWLKNLEFELEVGEPHMMALPQRLFGQ